MKTHKISYFTLKNFRKKSMGVVKTSNFFLILLAGISQYSLAAATENEQTTHLTKTFKTDEQENEITYNLLHSAYQAIKPIEESSVIKELLTPQRFPISDDQSKSAFENIKETIAKKSFEEMQNKNEDLIQKYKQDIDFNSLLITNDMEMKPQKYSETDLSDTLYKHFGLTKKFASVLSLDGGGFRGLMQAYWLDYLESKDVTNRNVHEIFNVIGGTSIGGILAMAATVPNEDGNRALSTNDMIDMFVKQGGEIFPQRYRYNYLGKFYDCFREITHCRYESDPLEKLLYSRFGSKVLGTALTNVVITSANADTQKPFLFNSLNDETKNYKMWEIGRSTSAAPTYFKSYPLISLDSKTVQYLMDGGIWCNNPSQIAYEAALTWAEKNQHIVLPYNTIMLSLGTGNLPLEYIQPRDGGWFNSAKPIIESMMNLSSEGHHKSMNQILGDKNYARINPELTENIKLDKIGEDNVKKLKDAAETQYEKIFDFAKDGRLRYILEKDNDDD